MSKCIVTTCVLLLLNFSSYLTGIKSVSTTADDGCTEREFHCHASKMCIPLEKKCDGNYGDCQLLSLFDNSDESDCTHQDFSQYWFTRPLECSRYEFNCRDGTCIDLFKQCNHQFDCPDGSDETECRSVCLSTEFRCNDGHCIPPERRCDRSQDCRDGSDELQCQLCNTDEFRCKSNGNCIPISWRCDENPDCPDFSDEFDCPSTTITTPTTPTKFTTLTTSIPQSPPTSNPSLNENSEHHVQHSTISTRSLVYDTNNHLGEPLKKEYINLPTDDQIGTEKYDKFYTLLLQIGQTKKINMVSKEDANFQSNIEVEENQQTGLKSSLDGKARSSEDQNNELRKFFGGMYEEAIQLTKKRQRRLKKVIFDFVHEMEEEQDKDSLNEKMLEGRLPLMWLRFYG